MKLKVLIPTEVVVEEETGKINAEAQNGAFCLKPRHVDYGAALVPGILSFENKHGQEVFLAVDEGILVKCGDDVLVSARNAVRGGELGDLQRIVEEEFSALDEKEKKEHSVMAKIEAGFVRRFLEVQRRG